MENFVIAAFVLLIITGIIFISGIGPVWIEILFFLLVAVASLGQIIPERRKCKQL